MRASNFLAAQVPFSFVVNANNGRLFERVDYLEAVNLTGNDTMFHERDAAGYTKAVWVVRENGTREPIRFRMTRG